MSETPRCPETGKVWSTAYRYGCRCDVCREGRRLYAAAKRADPGKAAEMREYNKAYLRKWRARPGNLDKANGYLKKWRTENRERDLQLRSAHQAKRRARGGEAPPAWVYEAAKALPGEYHVDHIVPLSRGGDNSLSNLQLLPAEENYQKGSKLESEIDFTLHPISLGEINE